MPMRLPTDPLAVQRWPEDQGTDRADADAGCSVCRPLWHDGPRGSPYAFGLLTTVAERGMSVATLWLKRPDETWHSHTVDPALPPFAETCVFDVEWGSCPRCDGPIPFGSGRPARFVISYDPDRITEGGLLEAHTGIVDQVRAGETPGWEALPAEEEH